MEISSFILRKPEMRILLVLAFLVATPSVFASPYIEYKNELKYRDTKFREDIHHFRLGYVIRKNFYVEAGPRSDGYSSEVGYKLKQGPFTFKGKWEGFKTEDFDHKVETEIRYSWD